MSVMTEVLAIVVFVHVSLDILVTVVLLDQLLVLEVEQELVVDQEKPMQRHLVSCHNCNLGLRCFLEKYFELNLQALVVQVLLYTPFVEG